MSDRERWNDRHAAAIAAGPGDPPAAGWVLEHRDLLASLPGGRALDVGCGRGRNALLLAELGFQVEALDVSDVALDHLDRRARERGLPIATRRTDLSADELPDGPFEVVVNTFYLERRLFGAMSEALAPGGLLLVVALLEGPAANPAHALARGELRTAFRGLDVIAHTETEAGAVPRPRASLVARRPLASRATAV